ncbi:MAG: hypothetical protein NVSMB29_11630 [Candidatus Dormibacteria bacterium]
MSFHSRRAGSRVATVGLALVLFALAGFSLWTAHTTQDAASQVASATALRDAYQKARVGVAEEVALRNSYQLHPAPEVRADYDQAAARLVDALLAVQRHGGSDDQTLVTGILGEHNAYTQQSAELFRAVDSGDPARAEQVAQGSASVFSAMVRHVNWGSARAVERSRNRLARLSGAEAAALAGTVAAFTVGLLLLVAFGVILRGYQRGIESQAEESRQQALHDALTGLANRTLLRDRLGQAIKHDHRTHGSFALLLLDLDRFKEVNDALGHHYGDRLLQQVGPRLVRDLRETDTVARLGGDEFAVLLLNTGVQGAMSVANKLLAALRETFVVDEQPLSLEASIGVAIFPDHGEETDVLLQRADIAMYSAKANHDGVAVYSPGLDDNTPLRLALTGELRRAIQGDQLELQYQPKVCLRTGRVSGVEALVRWNHPDRGLLMPAEFIDRAERTDLIHPLTAWVLENALGQWRRWQDSGIDLGIALNVSTRSLLAPEFSDVVVRALAQHGVTPGMLTLEITENLIMSDPVRTARVLSRLGGLGVRFSIDDFGTGYSSLSYLQTLPVHELKIDRSLIMPASGHANDAIIRATAELGHNLGLRVVAEGVETAAAWRATASLGCDEAQGYYLSQAVPPDDIPDWLAAWRRRERWRRVPGLEVVPADAVQGAG